MPLMSRKADYALLILSCLHRRPEGGCARAIAAGCGLSRSFVANILKELCHKGFVRSRRGVKGGYVLQRPADCINLAELLDALDEPFHLAECNKGGGAVCDLSPLCPVRVRVEEVHRRLVDVLRGVTLADLFGPAEEPGRRLALDVLDGSPCPGGPACAARGEGALAGAGG